MFSKILRGAVIAAIGVGGSVAQADPFAVNPTTRLLTVGGPQEGQYGSVNVTNHNGLGGEFFGSFGTASDDFFRFFCIELQQHTAAPTSYERLDGAHARNSTGADLTNAADNDQLSRLFDLYFPHKSDGNFLLGSGSKFGDFDGAAPTSSLSTVVESAAMQVAIWEIVFDIDFDLAKGPFQWLGSATDVSARAQTMLTDVKTGLGSSQGWSLYSFHNDVAQDYLSATYTYTPPVKFDPIPEPASLALLGIGLAGLGLARRKTAA